MGSRQPGMLVVLLLLLMLMLLRRQLLLLLMMMLMVCRKRSSWNSGRRLAMLQLHNITASDRRLSSEMRRCAGRGYAACEGGRFVLLVMRMMMLQRIAHERRLIAACTGAGCEYHIGRFGGVVRLQGAHG